jgi:putative endonuclease
MRISGALSRLLNALRPGAAHLRLGRRGEQLAERYLRSRGCRIVARRYQTRHGELDIIAWDGDRLCFVEVKTRRGVESHPEQAWTARKRRLVRAAAQTYLRRHGLEHVHTRFDLVTVRYRPLGRSRIQWQREFFRD